MQVCNPWPAHLILSGAVWASDCSMAAGWRLERQGEGPNYSSRTPLCTLNAWTQAQGNSRIAISDLVHTTSTTASTTAPRLSQRILHFVLRFCANRQVSSPALRCSLLYLLDAQLPRR